MRKRWLLLGAPAACGAALALFITTARGADHFDSEGPKNDPSADIDDVFAWVPSPGRTALVMTLGDTFVTANTRFGEKIEYRFAIRNVASNGVTFAPTADVRDVVCSADAGSPQTVTCKTANGLTRSHTVGAAPACNEATDDLCVWAGVRKDPGFVDLVGLEAVRDGGLGVLTPDGGTDGLLLSSVLAIVVNVDTAKALGTMSFDAGAGTPTDIVAVAAETRRLP